MHFFGYTEITKETQSYTEVISLWFSVTSLCHSVQVFLLRSSLFHLKDKIIKKYMKLLYGIPYLPASYGKVFN